MIAASLPVQRPAGARVLVVDAQGRLAHTARSKLAEYPHAGDLVVANDAATLPASLAGIHTPTKAPIEVRLAGRPSLAIEDAASFLAIVFGAGDFHTRTEDRPLPPPLEAGDELALGPLRAVVERTAGHPRLVFVTFAGSRDAIWSGLARHGRPVQYAHVPAPLELWDVWAPISAVPVAFEPPSAGFALDWRTIEGMRRRGVAFTTITHTAGISSTGDPVLDRLLPFDEPYRISGAAARAIHAARSRGGRVIAIGTTVVRALEHAGRNGEIEPGEGLANQRIGPATRLRLVSAILSGTHDPGSSHYELLRAFASDSTLRRAGEELEFAGYRTHEFGDSVLIEAASGI